MSDVLNRTTLQHLRSVNEPDYPVEDWIHGPDLSAVEGVDKLWWVIEGDTVREATTAEKDAKIETYRAAVKEAGYQQLSGYLGEETQEFDRIYAQGHLATNTYIQPYIDWRDTVYQGVATLAQALIDATTVAEIDAIRAQFDLTGFNLSKPNVTTAGALEVRYGVG